MEQATKVPASELSTNSNTMADMLLLAAEQHAEKPAIKHKVGDQWEDISYAELGRSVRKIAKGLIGLGIEPQQRIAILANTRPEWTYCDFGALTAGITVVPIYQTNSPEECEYVIENSDSVLVFVEDTEQLAKITQVRDSLPKLQHVVVMIPDGDIGDAISLDDLIARGETIDDSAVDKRANEITKSDICTIIYTSGTTGPPKGCLLSHGNYRSICTMAEENGIAGGDEVTYLFLPLAHAFALLIQFVSVDCGGSLAFWERDPLKIIPNLMEVQPTVFPSVPRIFEKIYTLANNAAAQKTPEEQELFHKAIEVGFMVREMQRKGEVVPAELQAGFDRAEEAVYQNVRALFGGKITHAVTGAAPISHEILKFFYACGILVLEGYGMTETSTAATGNTEEEFKFGSIGKPFPGVTLKIADDGEILVSGENIFQGYHKNAEATAETLEDGWLHTGDLGYVDEDGFVFINGRKKDIIITAGGKNITPANWENVMKQNRYVSQAVMYGDRRPYLTGIVTIDPEEAAALAAEVGSDSAEPADLAKNPKVQAIVDGLCEAINQKFARVEQVKKVTILDHDLSQPTGELTPTLKVKRNVVYEKYASVFDSMYDGD